VRHSGAARVERQINKCTALQVRQGPAGAVASVLCWSHKHPSATSYGLDNHGIELVARIVPVGGKMLSAVASAFGICLFI
jgi:hypothetical protein